MDEKKEGTSEKCFANRSNIGSDENMLCVTGNKDHRQPVVTKDDNRLIIQCIGRVCSRLKKTATKEIWGYGTATVFEYDKNKKIAYAITCAHNLVDKTEGEVHYYDKIMFERRETFDDGSSKHIHEYSIDHKVYHPEYRFELQSEYDLGIICFEDADLYYYNLFYDNTAQKKNSTGSNGSKIELFATENLPDPKFILKYHIYGYPCNNENDNNNSNSIVNDNHAYGGLYGMSGDSRNYDKAVNVPLYVKRKNRLFFYNSIDTQSGQAGSAIFLEFESGHGINYAITGVHSGGNAVHKQNWGVQLTQTKIDWINDQIEQMKSYKMYFLFS